MHTGKGGGDERGMEEEEVTMARVVKFLSITM